MCSCKVALGGARGLGHCRAETVLWGGCRPPRVVIVEPELAACLYESARQGGAATAVPIDEETIMAGLSCGEPSDMAWEILDEEAADFLTIPDSVVAPTVRLLANGSPKVEAGESAVAGLAAVIAACQDEGLKATLGLGATSRVLLIGSEGVTDPAIFATIMAGGADHV